jgi:hypothetical protein
MEHICLECRREASTSRHINKPPFPIDLCSRKDALSKSQAARQPSSILVFRASDKVVPARARVRQRALELPSSVEDDAVSTRRAARVGVIRAEDGKLVPRPLVGEVEAFVVVVLVRVVVVA